LITKKQALKALAKLDQLSLHYKEINKKNQPKYLQALGDLKEIFLSEAPQ
jgi:hypothetical protein